MLIATRLFKSMALMIALFGLLSLPACGKKKSKTSQNSAEVKPKPKPTNKPTDDNDEEAKRYCTVEITSNLDLDSWEARFAELFQWDVDGFEDPPTLCGDWTSYGSELDGAIMIEYEDNEGIAFLSLEEQHVFYGKINRSSVTSVEFIYNFSIEGVGFLLQLKGQSASGGNEINATIRYHRLATYEDQLSAAIKEAQQKCKDGTWTVAQCFGYNFPHSYWWENTASYTTPQQQQLDLARQLLTDNSKSKELGKTKFKLSEFMN